MRYFKWRQVPFVSVLPGGLFKASKAHTTWWVKKDRTTAVSQNGQLVTPWSDHDLVWIDIGQPLSVAAER